MTAETWLMLSFLLVGDGASSPVFARFLEYDDRDLFFVAHARPCLACRTY